MASISNNDIANAIYLAGKDKDENFWKWFAQLLASAQKHNIKIDNYFDKHPYCKV